MTRDASPEIRIALVGLGHVAQHQVSAIAQTDGLRLVAACDKNPETRRRVGDDVAFYQSTEDLLSRERFDIVMISAPNREHFRIASQVIDAGKDLVLEKPAVETRQQLDELVSRSARAGVWLHFSLHAAFGAEVLWFRHQLAAAKLHLGNLRCFRASFFDPYVTADGLAEGADSLGGSWMDSGINALSVLGNFVDPNTLRVAASRMRSPRALRCSETEALVSLESDTAQGAILTSWLKGQNHKSTILEFQNDQVLLDHSGQRVCIGTHGQRKTWFAYDGPLQRLTNHYVGVFSDLVAQYASGQSNAALAISLHRVFFDANECRDLVDGPLSDSETASN